MATVLWGWHTNGSFAAAVCYGAKLRTKKSGKHKEVVIFSTTKKPHSELAKIIKIVLSNIDVPGFRLGPKPFLASSKGFFGHGQNSAEFEQNLDDFNKNLGFYPENFGQFFLSFNCQNA